MKIIFTILLSFTSFLGFGQYFTYCETQQFEGSNASNPRIIETKNYNKKGLLINETKKKLKDTLSGTTIEDSIFYFYRDTLLTKVITVDYNNDSSKIFHYYNKKKQRIKTDYFIKEWQPKKKDNIKTKLKGCKKTDGDYEKNEVWELVSETHYKYDRRGNKKLEDAPYVHFPAQQKHKWKYDDNNRVIRHKSYDIVKWLPDNLNKKDDYEYLAQGYKFTRTLYSNNKNTKTINNPSLEYSPYSTYTYEVNDKGQTLEEIISDHKGKTCSRQKMEYNSYGVLSKKTEFNKDNQPLDTFLYNYMNKNESGIHAK